MHVTEIFVLLFPYRTLTDWVFYLRLNVFTARYEISL
jgi:hypothetical protein